MNSSGCLSCERQGSQRGSSVSVEAPSGKRLLFYRFFFLLLLRCQGAEAFEIQHSGLANGIFMKFLKDRLLEDKKITVLLDEVAEGKIKKIKRKLLGFSGNYFIPTVPVQVRN